MISMSKQIKNSTEHTHKLRLSLGLINFISIAIVIDITIISALLAPTWPLKNVI
jgi:hypothetical protein